MQNSCSSSSRYPWKGGALKEKMKTKKQAVTSTPYDDVYRTMANDCRPLLIPRHQRGVRRRFHRK